MQGIGVNNFNYPAFGKYRAIIFLIMVFKIMTNLSNEVKEGRKMSSCVFGPVPSRRLGRSLGVDLIPFKTCTYDCIYCQLGRTTCKTIERKEWVPLADVLKQVREKLSTKPDYITLSGSGEPTLYSKIGQLIAGIKSMTEIPVAVLTNGSLFRDPDIRSAIKGADLVVPSLDAGDEELFQYVNRPHNSISFDQLVEGLLRFRDEYSGHYWLEVFLLGATTPLNKIEKIVEITGRINPDRVQLNTVTRPPAEDFASPIPDELMQNFAQKFGGKAEVIADYRGTHQQKKFVALRRDVLDLLRRRPCSVDDIAQGLGMHRNEVVKYVTELVEENRLNHELSNGKLYYKYNTGKSDSKSVSTGTGKKTG
jgi:wyosine [tRNA(Phe)-imidazoG37] synthetase (radical SAM superfamily)